MTQYRTVIREDETGIYLHTNGTNFRPGEINGYPHLKGKMGDGNLSKSDKVKARHQGGTTITKIETQDGQVLFWLSDYDHEMEARRQSYFAENRPADAEGILADLGIKPQTVTRL